MMRRLIPLLASLLCAAALTAADLDAVRSERDPNRRAELALNNAEMALNETRNAAHAGDTAKVTAALNEGRESADLCYDSLRKSGKSPRRNNHYKKAELKLRALIRMLDGFTIDIPLEQREDAAATERHMQEVHDHILQDEMEAR